ncbi:E3 ubiquitin- ligase MIB2-like [Brachionus plicatilis]|uniref:E3 ubiquitin-ligase MIB2-like n=1 Tax=Brachionus plicatilis TaxID=10195 RepID=A0A3M7SEH7_BRAPC|nr:E3 ubiquitin- ligase MIB2-like [Brachionus plicatilis]
MLEVADNIPEKLKGNIRVIIALYLIKNGANLYSRNRYNFTCLDFISDDLIKNYLIEYYSSLYYDLNLNRLTLKSSLKTNEVERCKLCDEEPITVTFLPCKHKCVCFDCSIRIKKCTDCHQCVVQKVDMNGTSLNFSRTELSELLQKKPNNVQYVWNEKKIQHFNVDIPYPLYLFFKYLIKLFFNKCHPYLFLNAEPSLFKYQMHSLSNSFFK